MAEQSRRLSPTSQPSSRSGGRSKSSQQESFRALEAQARKYITHTVQLEKVIDRRLRSWGINSPDDRQRLARAIQLAVAKVTKPPPLPEKGQLPFYLARKSHPKLAKLDILDFLRTVWGKWIKARVVTRLVLREFDPGAERALRYWLQHHNNKLPEDLYIPTQREINDELIASGEASRDPRVAYLLAARHTRGTRTPL